MSWSIDFAPMLPAAFFWAAGALAVLLIGYLLYRRSRGALLRAAAIAALLAALANPILREEQRDPPADARRAEVLAALEHLEQNAFTLLVEFEERDQLLQDLILGFATDVELDCVFIEKFA